MKNIVIFGSGSGSNAENIFSYFSLRKNVSVSLFVTNKKNSLFVDRARRLGVNVFFIADKNFSNLSDLILLLNKNKTDLIVLAGFLLKVPLVLINCFKNKIINIHPSLLPKFGGKGMYGINVHNAVIKSNESVSGITIHYVNEKYDDGKILFQKSCTILPNETAFSLSKKIQLLEHKFFPLIIEKTLCR